MQNINSYPKSIRAPDPCVTPVWYIVISLEHELNKKYYTPATETERFTDTLQLFPATLKFPVITTEAYLRQSIRDILDIIKYPPNTLTFLFYGGAKNNDVHQIAHLLNLSPKQPCLPIMPLPPIQTNNCASKTSSSTSSTSEGSTKLHINSDTANHSTSESASENYRLACISSKGASTVTETYTI